MPDIDDGELDALVAVPNTPADVASLRSYLGGNSSQWTDADLASTIAAEADDQARRVSVPTPMPAALLEALWRRVARNLAMRAVPLGIMASEMGGQRVSRLDPEVRRLEASYRRVGAVG